MWNGATCNNCNGKRCTVCGKFKIIKDSVKYPTDFNWHTCHYAINRFVVDDEYEWIEGRWYFWKDCYGNIEKARMKMDILNDHFYPNPKTINEEDIIAFQEIEGNPFRKISIDDLKFRV